MIVTCLVLTFIIYARKHKIFNFKKLKKSEDSKTEIMLNSKNIMFNIFLLALPIMFSNLLKSIHDVVDLYYVSEVVLPGVPKEIAEKSLEAMFSAINVTTPIINVCQALAMGFMVAGLSLMSQYLGAKKEEKARAVSAHLLMFCFFVGVVTNILLFIFAPNILNLMGAEDEIYDYSLIYVRYRSFELIGLFVFYSFQATRQSSGDTVTPVVLNVISVILNIVFSVFLY